MFAIAAPALDSLAGTTPHSPSLVLYAVIRIRLFGPLGKYREVLRDRPDLEVLLEPHSPGFGGV